MRERIEELVSAAIKSTVDAGELELSELPQPALERPRDEAHGDWATTVALRSAKLAGQNPRDIAQLIAAHIEGSEFIDKIEIAGPGFINLYLSPTALQSVLKDVREAKEDYGRCDLGQGRSIQIEFVSANPTGPMHVGHGRWAALGDSLGKLLAHAGWKVEREFYINDAGNQMDIFGRSVSVRYLQLCRLMEQEAIDLEAAGTILVADTTRDIEDRQYAAEIGEDGYGGAYIIDIAAQIVAAEGTVWAQGNPDEREAYFKERAYTQVLTHVKEVLASCGVHFDVWFSERKLHEKDASGQSDITRAIAKLDEDGYIFNKDDALWFASTRFGDDKDRVLVKADGDYTYFAADIAYHADKFSRGFDRVINIWGADHHGYVPRMQAACAALGYEGKLDIIIGQLVNLLRDGEPVRLSKRKGTMVSFEELLSEVGSDATRYLMINKSTDQSIDFDIEIAKKQDSSNPVFYVQYAHARICSILRKAAAEQTDDMEALACALIENDCDLSPLIHPAEFALMRKLDQFSEIVSAAARDYAPFRLTHYAEELAATFHQFYTQCHVLSDDAALSAARLYMVDASRIVLGLVLKLLGVSAPTRM